MRDSDFHWSQYREINDVGYWNIDYDSFAFYNEVSNTILGGQECSKYLPNGNWHVIKFVSDSVRLLSIDRNADGSMIYYELLYPGIMYFGRDYTNQQLGKKLRNIYSRMQVKPEWPEKAMILFMEADSLISSGSSWRMNEARIRYQRGLEIAPWCSFALLNQAGLLEKLNFSGLAIEHYNKFLELVPRTIHRDSIFKQIENLKLIKQAAETLDRNLYYILQKFNPNNYQRVLESCNEVLQVEPENQGALLYKSYCLEGMGDIESAKKILVRLCADNNQIACKKLETK